jgi:hypothetical protein
MTCTDTNYATRCRYLCSVVHRVKKCFLLHAHRFRMVRMCVERKWIGMHRNKKSDLNDFVGVSRPGGSLDRRVNCRRVPQPRWVGARRSAKGGGSRRETGVRGGIPRPSCLSHAQVGCACSRGSQAPTREGASGLTRAPSRPSPRGQPSVRGPWSFLL